MPAPTLTLTIVPDSGGKAAMWVSVRDADGTQGPARKISIDPNDKLAGFVAAMQAIARLKLTPVESSTVSCAGDGDPAVAVEPANREQIRQQV